MSKTFHHRPDRTQDEPARVLRRAMNARQRATRRAVFYALEDGRAFDLPRHTYR